MFNFLIYGIIIGASLLLFFEITERNRFINGKEMLIDKLIRHLEDIYRRTAPKDNDELDTKDYFLSDKIIIRKVSFPKKDN